MATQPDRVKPWTVAERFIFRTACLFFLTMSVPLSWDYYSHLVSLDWSSLTYRDVTNLGRFSVNILNIQTESGRWGLASYADWGIVMLGALIGALVWPLFDKRKSYRELYYWLRAVVRYRIAIGMIEFGFVKVFLIQMPFPPIATLHTNFGDFTAQKLYWLSVGVIPNYEVFLGFVEVIAGFLLFFRKTVVPGAFLTLCASANIVYINHAYDGGVHVYSAYFVLLSLFLLWRDIPAIGKLLICEQDVIPQHYRPVFDRGWQRVTRFVIKSAFIVVFVVLLAVLHWRNYNSANRNMKLPVEPGLDGSAGYYQVKSFKWNDRFIPYSPFDSIRWHDAIFENYSTLSVKANRREQIELSNGVPREKGRYSEWEYSGRAGGRQFYYYDVDATEQVLLLQDKQQLSTRRGRDRLQETSPVLRLSYDRPNDSTIILSGKKGEDWIYVHLERMVRRYPLVEGDNYR